jgi:signal transduction histidine kinase
MPTFARFEILAVMVDRVQLQQVLINLMLNAIEAVKDSVGEFAVKSELQDGQLQLSVSDKGVGLPIEKMDRIFSAFFTNKPQDSGMGLAISRSIVESHGGQLWASANDEVQPFISARRSGSRIHGPRLPKASGSSEYFSVEPAALSHFVILAVVASRSPLLHRPSLILIWAIELLGLASFQFGRFSFFKNAANRGSLCKLLNKGSTFVSIRPPSRWA